MIVRDQNRDRISEETLDRGHVGCSATESNRRGFFFNFSQQLQDFLNLEAPLNNEKMPPKPGSLAPRLGVVPP